MNITINSSYNYLSDIVDQLSKERGDNYMKYKFHTIKNPELNNENIEKYIYNKLENDKNMTEICNALWEFYKSNNYYVFYKLVKFARSQLRSSNKSIDLSHDILEKENLPFLTARAMWEITYDLHEYKYEIKSLILRGNKLLSPECLNYLNIFTNLQLLDITDTNLTIQDLNDMDSLKCEILINK